MDYSAHIYCSRITLNLLFQVLELVETCLDCPLAGGNRVKYRFQDTPLLSGGVSIHETIHNVVVLVVTVGSVHKMVFQHPNRLTKQDIRVYQQGGEAFSTSSSSIPSIFADASHSTPMENVHLLPNAGTTPLPHTAATWLDTDDEAMFALANSAGNITLIKLGNLKGIVTSNSLKSSSYLLGRLWAPFGGMLSRNSTGGSTSGIGTSGFGAANDGVSAEAAVSLAIHPIQSDVYVFALCRDHKIRMWLASSSDCVMVSDVLMSTTANTTGSAKIDGRIPLHQGAQSHMLRKVSDPKTKGNFALAVFLCFAQHSQFCIFRPIRTDGQWQLDYLATVFSPDFDLIDFSVTPAGHLVALWTNPDGLPVLRYAGFGSSQSISTLGYGSSSGISAGDSSGAGWMNVTLEDPLNPDFQPPGTNLSGYEGSISQVDPRQAYLQQLFYPGRFSIPTLAKTISIYRRSMDMSYNPNSNDYSWTISKLKEEVCSAVEFEIQNQVTEYEITDEEHISISHAAWARFYSCAIQYHEAGLKPMGLIVDGYCGLLCIIKKGGISFVRPVDALEHLVLTECVAVNGPDLFHDTPTLCEDPALAHDVVSLMKAVTMISGVMPPYLGEEFEHALNRLMSPDEIGRKIVNEILSAHSDNDDDDSGFKFNQELSTRLQQVGDIAKALEVLLLMLELDRGIVSHSNFDPTSEEGNEPSEISSDTCNLFASPEGVSVLAESLKQMSTTRFRLTRDIIILQLIMLECGLSEGISGGGKSADTDELIRSTYLPRSVVMAHCYYVLVWLTETLSTAPPPNSLEQGLRQMAVLKISDNKKHALGGSAEASAHQAAQIARTSSRPLTLSELFLRGPGSKARSLLTTNESDHCSPWYTVLTPLVNISAQLLWPRCAVPAFQQFLLAACQHMQIQEYVRLLSTWCDYYCHSRQFLLGSALLNMAEPEKACDWMIQAVGGVVSDRFLSSQIFSRQELGDEDENADALTKRLTILYFLKVIQLFEQFGYYDYVIDLAETAMGVCDEADPDRTTLCYILFSYHLKLGHNDEAYDAMVANPDKSRRKDSLRQFIVTLFDRKQLKKLANYPYINMFEDVELIIESRARSVDLTVNNYYDFLYSFHVMKENYRKAAHVMYECGMRLGTELFTLEGLKRQAKCYLACLNCLKLVSEKNAWIVRPVLNTSEKYSPNVSSSSHLPPGMSPKRSADGEELSIESRIPPKRMEVLEMSEIEREFQLLCARLKLANKHQTISHGSSTMLMGPAISPNETVSLLISSNLYEDAVKIASSYDPPLDFKPIVEGLSMKCVQLSRGANTAVENAWDWLAENNPSSPKNDIGSSSSVEAAWKLLESLVTRLQEKESGSQLLKAVVTRLFSMNAFLPSWLVAKYKKANPSELLRLYLVHGFIEDAGLLACEYIAAVLGTGTEYFGLPNALHATSAPVWLPHNTIDQLLLELKEHSDEPVYHSVSIEH